MTVACMLTPEPASAQLSPGPLSEAHAGLEGSRSCLACHSGRRGVDPELCLECHGALEARIQAGQGLHAGSEFGACERCHIEHQGRDFELVWWGDGGLDGFDHERVGHRLDGAHAEAGCRDCHRPGLLSLAGDPSALGVDPESTFLGLDRSCSSCHADPHAGQFAGRDCDACHDSDGFEAATGFSHSQTRFALLGEHADAPCGSCHPQASRTADDRAAAATLVGGAELAASRSTTRYAGVDFADCSSCHREDPHQGRLGGRCANCHQPSGWSDGARSGFEHSRTGFDLRGAHREVACESCHGDGLALARPPSGECTDCHLDVHFGAWSRSDGASADCGGCHRETGFTPSTYDVAAHAGSAFPLTGRHAAIACERCHVPVPLAQLAGAAEPADPAGDLGARRRARPPHAPPPRFAPLTTPPSESCTSCHTDPHRASFAAVAEECVDCHDTSSWSSVGFSHRATGFLLELGHRGVGCRDCHDVEGSSQDDRNATVDLLFDVVSTECAACHVDPHGGQFAIPSAAENGVATTCERCHPRPRFAPAELDHDDARFALEGAHAAVACAACHPTVETATGPRVLYRPLPHECSDCHDGGGERLR